jgi:hypothetical protein
MEDDPHNSIKRMEGGTPTMTLERLPLADRTEAILRGDRHALRRGPHPGQEPGILLALLPDDEAVITLMDAYLKEIADLAGLDYLRPETADLAQLPRPTLSRTFLVLADLTGRDEHVVTQVYHALSLGRRVLLSAQSEEDIPRELGARVPAVLYSPQRGRYDDLLREVLCRAQSTLDDRVISG